LKTKHIIIVTGLSGAGKTTALNILEDMNYYTIDNLPLGLEKSLLDTEIEKLAVGIDIRTFKNTKDFFKFINYIKESGVKMDIVFIEAHEAIILGRYTLSRRAHPLKEVTLLRSILKEKKILFPIREIADLVIDTTDTKTVELEKRFKKFILAKDEDNIDINQFKNFLLENLQKGDYVLIQGEWGLTYNMVNFAKENNFIPLYAGTTRKVTEYKEGDKEEAAELLEKLKEKNKAQ